MRRSLTPGQFGQLAEVPPELEWLANITMATLYASTRRLATSITAVR